VSFALPVSKSTQSAHFKVLREAGLICQRDEGNRHLNRLRREDLDARFSALLDLVTAQVPDAKIDD
jgi:DNA-binding transcriptional ArsR family regulator